MDNETCPDPAWGVYWSKYVNDRASIQNTHVETTEMWDDRDPTDGAVPGGGLSDRPAPADYKLA